MGIRIWLNQSGQSQHGEKSQVSDSSSSSAPSDLSSPCRTLCACRDYEEMVEANRKLAERLTKTPSVYPRQKMAKDWAESESLRRWCPPLAPLYGQWCHHPYGKGHKLLTLRADHALFTPSSRISQKRPRSLLAPPNGISSSGSVGSISSLGSMQSSLPSTAPPSTAPIFSPVGSSENRSHHLRNTSEFSFQSFSNDRYRSPAIPSHTETPWN